MNALVTATFSHYFIQKDYKWTLRVIDGLE